VGESLVVETDVRIGLFDTAVVLAGPPASRATRLFCVRCPYLGRLSPACMDGLSPVLLMHRAYRCMAMK